MKASFLLALCAVAAVAYANDTSPPIADGRYKFVVKLAEQPNVDIYDGRDEDQNA